MPTHKKRSKSFAVKNNNVLIFFVIVLVLAIVSVVAAYYLSGEENLASSYSNTSQIETDITQITPIEGTWVSNYDGTMLTIENMTVSFESPSVDESNTVSSEIAIEESIITFNDKNGTCKNIEGHYLYSIDEKGELNFKLIKDSCAKRQELMSMSWFKL